MNFPHVYPTVRHRFNEQKALTRVGLARLQKSPYPRACTKVKTRGNLVMKKALSGDEEFPLSLYIISLSLTDTTNKEKIKIARFSPSSRDKSD